MHTQELKIFDAEHYLEMYLISKEDSRARPEYFIIVKC